MIERTVRGGGLDLCLCQWGAPGAPLLVILHGFLDQGAAWYDVATALADRGQQVLAPDHRGHGRSDHVPAGGYYHFPDYLRDLDAWTRGLPPFVLVGHSMGGTVACMFAAVRPDRVRALVLVEGTGPAGVADQRAPEQLTRHLDQVAAARPHRVMPGIEAAVERLRRFNPSLRPQLARLLAERSTEPVEGGAEGAVRWRWDALHRTRSAMPFDLDRFLVFLSRIRAPTTVITGAKSPFQPDRMAERLAALPVVARHTLETGHSPHFEAPDELAALIAQAAS